MSLTIRWPRIRAEGSAELENPAAYLDDVYRYARTRLSSREDAEDVACEVVQAFPARCRRNDLRVYMIGVARRKIADRLRRSRPTVALGEADSVGRFDDNCDQAAMVAQVLGRLAEDQREALSLKYVIGLTSAEIGALLDRTPEAIDSLLQRARAAFAREWTALMGEETLP